MPDPTAAPTLPASPLRRATPWTSLSLFLLLVSLLATALALAPNTSRAAADLGSPAPTPTRAKDRLAEAKLEVAEQRWGNAIEILRRVNDTANADWHNLLGYSLRKNNPPDLATAERHYNEALRINPQHRGALEYSGELYLMKGDLAQAEQRLATLNRLCPNGCEEQADLQAAIARHKAKR